MECSLGFTYKLRHYWITRQFTALQMRLNFIRLSMHAYKYVGVDWIECRIELILALCRINNLHLRYFKKSFRETRTFKTIRMILQKNK